MYEDRGQEKRTFLAIFIILVVTLLWMYFSPKPPPPPKQKIAQDVASKPIDAQKAEQTEKIKEKPRKTKRKELSEVQKTYDKKLYAATYSNLGASIRSLRLKKYRQKLPKDSALVGMFDLGEVKVPILWKFRIGGEEFTSDIPFEIAESDSDKIKFRGELISLADKSAGENGYGTNIADLTVTYGMNDEDYKITYYVDIENKTDTDMEVSGILKLYARTTETKPSSFFLFARPNEPVKAIFDLNDKVKRNPLAKISTKGELLSGDIGWLGVTDKYFMTALMPVKPSIKTLSYIDDRDVISFMERGEVVRTERIAKADSNVVRLTGSIPKKLENSQFKIERDGTELYEGQSFTIVEEASGCYGKKQSLVLDIPRNSKMIDNLFSAKVEYQRRKLKAGESIGYSTDIFAGPKEISILKKMGKNVDRAIDLGDWIGPISRPLLYFLKWLYSLIPNYGVAIIILTLVVRLILYPLTAMQSKSMKKMQLLKPEMDKLKAKYGSDKEALNREMMKLWKIHKVNPLGGCFPLVLQLPIFFALYRVLYNAIELRHTPFFFWIKDLSDHDPYFVTPILMGISFFLQQQMMPQTMGDQAQQKMMKWMFPIMFTAIMLFLPSGLVIYIFVSTILGIVQQFFNMREKKKVAAKT